MRSLRAQSRARHRVPPGIAVAARTTTSAPPAMRTSESTSNRSPWRGSPPSSRVPLAVLEQQGIEPGDQVQAAPAEAVHDARPAARRDHRAAIHESPLVQFHELLVDALAAELEFLRQVLRMIDTFREEREDSLAALGGEHLEAREHRVVHGTAYPARSI